jgi:hypothetical protein
VIDGRHADVARDEMQLEATHVLKARRTRRSAQEGSKGSDGGGCNPLVSEARNCASSCLRAVGPLRGLRSGARLCE